MKANHDLDAFLIRDAVCGTAGGLFLSSPLFAASWYWQDTVAVWARAIAHLMV